MGAVAQLEMRALGRRDRKKQQTRIALITAALRLVDERGVERVTVEEISEAADVSTRTFFNYFATKDDALIGDPLVDPDELRERLLAAPADLPLLNALMVALTPAIEQIEADRDLWRLRLRVIKDNPSLLPALFARGTEAEAGFIAAIAARVKVGADDVYPALAASVVGAAFRCSMMRWAVSDGDPVPLVALTHEALGILAGGLKDPAPTIEEDR